MPAFTVDEMRAVAIGAASHTFRIAIRLRRIFSQRQRLGPVCDSAIGVQRSSIHALLAIGVLVYFYFLRGYLKRLES